MILTSVFMLATGHATAQGCGIDVLERAVFGKVYVPAYSRVLTHEGIGQPLASTMVVHNVDPELTITITSVTYFDRDGTKLKSFIEEPVELDPFGSQSFLVPINEQGGGFGSNYVIEWTSVELALTPAVEAVMVGGTGTHGISFTSIGRMIECRRF